jgi:bifunctional non-homologous end joining protein LigD
VRDTLLRDPTWCLQEKFDGERRLVVKSNANAEGLNRKGLYIPLLAPIAATVNRLPCTSCVLDGEQVGETLHVFDILELDGERLSERSYGERLHALNQPLAGVDPDAGAVTPVKTAFLPADKRQLMTEVERRDGEGVVLKMLGGVYQAGRPSSGGDQLKFKFYATASCVVRSHTPGKRSVAVGAFDGNNVVDLGNVTIPPNHAIPAPGDVVEVRYLYAYPGGSLYQPIYLGKRSDIDPSECALDQLKYKAPPPAPRRASGMGL